MHRCGRRRLEAMLTFVLVVPMACTGSNGTSTSDGDVELGGTVTMRIVDDWTTLDPIKTTGTQAEYTLYAMLYDRVVAIDPSGEILPALATSWEQTPDSVTLQLRDDATCADGTDVTPDVVAASLKRLEDSGFAPRTVGTAGFTVTSDSADGTVTITTNEPFSDLLVGLAMPWASIVCSGGLENPEALESEAFGSGPFTLQSSQRGSTYTLSTRPEYDWGPNGLSTTNSGFPQEIVLRLIKSDSTAANLLLTGDLDAASIFGSDADRVASESGIAESTQDLWGADYLTFNESPGLPGADPLVRAALAHAVDPAAWNQATYLGQGTIAGNYITPAVPCFVDLADLVQSFDTNEAIGLLRQAGWVQDDDGKLTKNGQPLEIRLVGVDYQKAGPEYLQTVLTDLGATVKLRVLSDSDYVGVVLGEGMDWDVTPFPFNPPMPSPNSASLFLAGEPPSEGGVNLTNAHNNAFEQAREEALATTGPEQCTHWADAATALIENVDLKPLVYYSTRWFSRGVELLILGGGNVMPIAVNNT